jgi:translocation and assembly module TamB
VSEPEDPPRQPPTPRRRKRLLWAAGALAALAALLVAVGAWLVSSQGGARFTVAQLSQILPGKLTVERVEGPIRGPLTLHGVHYETERFIVDIARVRLDWRLRQLRRRILDVESLDATGVVVRILPSEEVSDRKLTDINMRYNVVVRALRVDDVKIFRPGEELPVVIDTLTMRTGAWRDAVRIEDIDVISPHFDLEARGWLRPSGDYPLDVDIVWGYRPPEDAARQLPGFAGRGTLGGTLRSLRVEQLLEQPFRAEIEAVVSEPLFDPVFAGGVEFSGLDPRIFSPDLPVTSASGVLNAEGRGLAEFLAEGKLRLATLEWGEADTELRLKREAESWRFEKLTLRRPGGAPGSATFVGLVEVPEGKAPRFEGKVSWEDLTWPLTGPGEPTVRSARGTAAGEGTVDDYTLVVDGAFAFPEVPPGRYRFTAEGTRSALAVESLDAQVLGGRLAGSGRVEWEGEVSYRFQTTARGIDPHATWDVVPAGLSGGTWRLTGDGTPEGMRLESVRIETPRGGVLTATGRVDWEPTFRWQADARTTALSPAVLFPDVPAELTGGDWRLVASGDDRHADVERVEGAFLGGEVIADGAFTWEPAVTWRFAGTGRGLDPAQAYPGWDGDLAVDFRTTGDERGGALHGEVVVSQAAGTLRGRPLDGSGTVLLRGEEVHLDAVKATWGPGNLALDGQIAPQLALTFAVDDLDLAAVVPEAAGILEARGRIDGSTTAPHVQATLAGENLGFGTYRAATLAGRAEVDLAEGGAVDLDLDATEVDLGARRFDTLEVVVAGTREAHRIAASGSGEGLSLSIAATGSLPDLESWRGTLEELTAEARETGRWELAAPTPLVLSRTAVEVDQLCWVSAGARLCADVSWRQDAELAVTAQIEDLPLSLVEPFLPPEVEVTGTLDGSAQLRTTGDGVLIGSAVLRPAPGTALWDEVRGEEVRLAIEGGEVRLDADASGARAVLALRLADAGTVDGQVTLPGFRFGRPPAEQPLTGRFDVELADIGFVEALVPDLGTTTGRLETRLTLEGSLAAPAVRGEGRLVDGSTMLPQFGLELREIQLTARGTGTGPLAIEGSARSGEGILRFTGTSPLLPSADQPLRLDVTGRDVTVIATEEANVVANPDLQIGWNGSLVRVAGQVVVPRATIDYQREEGGRVRASSDVVYVGAVTPEAVADEGIEMEMRVRVVLGEDVKLRALGLRTDVEGSLLLVDQPGMPAPTASGQLELEEGTFRAYGQDLTIERGRLFFAGGPISNPGLDVRAYRRVPEGNVTAGLQARGTLRAPEVTLWSDPAMGESEILSYLLIGRPLDSAVPEEGNMLANAASALGVGGGNLLAKKLAARWGLEEARFESEGGFEETAFVVGKYLSPRLYVSYGIGLFDAVNTIRVRYLVSEKWTLQAESGTVTSGDVLYTIERGSPNQGDGMPAVPELPRVTREELTTPTQVPVNAEGVAAPATAESPKPLVGGDDVAPDVANSEDEPDGDPDR